MSKKNEKIIVTNFSTKKCDCEHYGLSDEIDVFFKSLRCFSKNGHLFLSIFQKSKILLEKTIHLIHFGVRPPNLCGLTFMLCAGCARGGHVATIMLRML
jgi:hypothetical protein